MRTDHFIRSRGSAIILVLWCLILLSMAVLGVVEMVELSVQSTAHHELLLEARALASSGVALGSNPQLIKSDPLFAQKTDDGQFKVAIGSEGARLNLNYILSNNHREILVHLFTQWGLSISAAARAADCLYDWVTPGDLPSLNGAKAKDYEKAELPQRPTGQGFESLSEVEQVIGMEAVAKAKPNWRDSFTLWSSGPLNVSEAPAELIGAVFGIDPKRVVMFTEIRNGKDGVAGTADDVVLPDMKTLQSDLGISDDRMKDLQDEVALSDPVRRVESVGQAGRVQVMISVVTRLDTSPVQYLLWSEQ